jgi:Animal haem peroxidase
VNEPGEGGAGWEVPKAEGIALLERGEFEDAVERLRAAARGDPTGETHALLGLALFHRERYRDAADCYAEALAADGDQPEWGSMLAACRANAVAEVDVPVPDVVLVERDQLLALPPDPRLPSPPREPARTSLWTRVRYLVGHGIGSVAGAVMHRLTMLIGKHYSSDVWTTWYRKRLYAGILNLEYMRDMLNARNLRSTYPAGTNVGFLPGGLEPPEGVTHFRTADGSWNNLSDPKEGAAGTRFPRNVDNAAIAPASDEELLSPNPRTVSRKLLSRGDEMVEVRFLNLLAASWIQFQNNDWITHGDNVTTDIIEIPLDEDDPARRRYRQAQMFVARTQPDPTRQDTGEETPVTFINEVTHWWDGSQIYGSDQATQDRLRSGDGGRLSLTDDATLPLDRHGVEDSGMVRNWWVGLAMLHNLFAREHNAICDHLAEHHPDWDDGRLFNVARLVNAAVMAKIHTVEWTPAILPNRGLDLALNSNWYGMLTYRFRKPGDRKTVATYNIASPELGGVVGNKLDRHGAPYGLTEEFVEVYRLHSLLPETLRLRRHDSGVDLAEVPFVTTRQAGSAKLTGSIGMTDLFYSFGNQHPGALVLHNYPRFMQELSIPGNPVFDMGAVDILRARERGVPRYNEFRRQLGLNPIRTFDDLTDDAAARAAITEVYGDDVEGLDLLVGTLAEAHRPTGFGFGETMFQIFILNATRRLQADRFYTDDFREEVYTAEGMRWIDRTSFKDVILRHFPELASTGLGNIKNAFEPWDTEAELDPARHPLRAFDPVLKKNPWQGDATRT